MKFLLLIILSYPLLVRSQADSAVVKVPEGTSTTLSPASVGLDTTRANVWAALFGKLSSTGNGGSLTGLSKTQVGLSNVENTAISTFPGSANIVTVGTVGTGTWNATAIADSKIASALTGKTYNGLTVTPTTGVLTITNGKTFAVQNTMTLAGTDGSTLNIGSGGTLGSNAFNSTAFAPIASPTFTGTISGITPAMVGLANVNNTSDASKPISTATQTSLDLKAPLASPTFTGTVILPNNTVTNAMLAGSIDLPTKVTGVLPFSSGGGASAATSATTGTITVLMTTRIITCTPTGNMTLNASGGTAGQIITFSFTTSGTSSFTITFGTNFRKTGTLSTGTVSARFFTVTFICLDGTIWTEVSRTAVQS